MISKSRLEELIEQGAVIYDIFQGDIYLVDLTMINKLGDIGVEYYNDYYHCNLCRNADDLFETKEEVEEYIGFANVTRTDRLPYIGWNERDCIIFTFYSPMEKGGNLYEFRLFKGGNISIWRTDDMYQVFNKPTTRENYTLAYRKAKELFLGENDFGVLGEKR